MIVRAGLLFVAMYAVTMLAILRLVPLPEIPLLRYVVFVLPVFASIALVACWIDQGAPWPAVSVRWRRQPHGDGRPTRIPQPIQSRTG